MIFQDPTTHINPVRKIGDFLTEALVTNNGVQPAEARETVAGILRDVGITDASAGSASTRTSSPAACCSAS